MENISSVNVSSLNNSFCKKMVEAKNTVCGKCYSNRYSKLRPTLEKRLLENSDVLSTRLLLQYETPLFNARYVRFNSFGEIINDIHYLNLLQIANHNPHTTFGLWTKRSDIVMKFPKEKNIKYIHSALHIDSPKASQAILEFFDKVFVVKKKHSEDINCNSKCMECLLCYTDNDVKFINEKLK